MNIQNFRYKIGRKLSKESILSFLRGSQTLSGLPFWLGGIVAGGTVVAYDMLFKAAEKIFLLHFHRNPAFIFIVTPLGFLLAWFFAYRLAPNAIGSGIPQVIATIELTKNAHVEKKLLRNLVSMPITIVKILSSLLIVVCGGAVGSEGPSVQIAAYVFHSIGLKFDRIWRTPFEDVFFITGGAAGIAAAFNTPLGGIVYGIEELARSQFTKFRTSLITGVIISGVVAQALAGSYLYIGIPTLAPYTSKVTYFAIFIGVIAGLAGALFGRGLYLVTVFRNSLKKTHQLVIVSLVSGLVLASMIYFFGDEGATSGHELISQLLFSGRHADFKVSLLRFFGPIVTYLSGSSGGTFSPSISAGAAIGGWISDLSFADHHNTCVILGMIAFMSGFMQAPFTAFVIVLEMTDRNTILFPMMISALIAYLVSQMVSPVSFYELVKEIFLTSKIFQSEKTELPRVES